MQLVKNFKIIMKVAILTKYGNLAASARQRFYQYQPYLEKEGFQLIKKPLFDDDYLNNLYKKNKRNILQISKCYFNRIIYLLSKPNVDLIWLHCELLPYLPSIFERLITLTKKPIIFDFDDAIFHNYDLSPKYIVKKFLGSKLHTTINQSRIAFCGNEYLARYARPLCQNVKIVPTIVDSDKLYPISKIKKKSTFKDRLDRHSWNFQSISFKKITSFN